MPYLVATSILTRNRTGVQLAVEDRTEMLEQPIAPSSKFEQQWSGVPPERRAFQNWQRQVCRRPPIPRGNPHLKVVLRRLPLERPPIWQAFEVYPPRDFASSPWTLRYFHAP